MCCCDIERLIAPCHTESTNLIDSTASEEVLKGVQAVDANTAPNQRRLLIYQNHIDSHKLSIFLHFSSFLEMEEASENGFIPTSLQLRHKNLRIRHDCKLLIDNVWV